MSATDRAVIEAAVALGRGLRAQGLETGVDQELWFCRALAEVDIRRRDRVYWCARAVFVHSPDVLPRFELVFARFWRGLPVPLGEPRAEHGETDPRMPGPQHGGQSLPQYRQHGGSSQLLDGRPNRATREIPSAGREEGRKRHGARRGALAAYSPDDITGQRRLLDYAPEELLAVRRLADELREVAPQRRTRRLEPSRGRGRLDLRRTLRHALATDGEAVCPAYVARSRKPRRLLFICDVSGSMERYSRALLGALQAAVRSGVSAEAFVFATRLTRLTGDLDCRDTALALERARGAVADWSGGTRIGQTLSEFNRGWGRRGLSRGAIVVIVSDGWDRGDPELLGRELERLRLRTHRLVWLNPRPAEIDGQPLAIGMRAALPHVDDFVAGHDPQAVARLAQVIGRIGSGRPARRQRPLGLVAP